MSPWIAAAVTAAAGVALVALGWVLGRRAGGQHARELGRDVARQQARIEHAELDDREAAEDARRAADLADTRADARTEAEALEDTPLSDEAREVAARIGAGRPR